MAVTADTELSAGESDAILRAIHAESTASADLTPRSREVLDRALAEGRLVIAFVNGQLAGWGLREPLAPGVFELGYTYTRPEFRREPVFRVIAHKIVETPATYVFATYHPSMLEFLARELGFMETSLARVLIVSRGRFLTKRLSREARRSVGKRLRTGRPRYGLLK